MTLPTYAYYAWFSKKMKKRKKKIYIVYLMKNGKTIEITVLNKIKRYPINMKIYKDLKYKGIVIKILKPIKG